jgi:C-terminal processing protease CtpA/Prc
VVNHAVANLIREGKSVQIPSIMQTNRGIGMRLLNDELAEMIEARKIDLADALSHSVDKKDLERRFRTGMMINSEPSGERFRVMDVKPNSPAQFAGLRRGHMIVEIDGKPASQYSLDEARRALRMDGTHALTLIETGGKRHKINLELPTM